MGSQWILPYIEMCQREGTSLQRGMNFRLRGRHSVILMSTRPNAPYADRIEDNGSALIYEGHDVPQTMQTPYPKQMNQVEFLSSGKLTENGKFTKAAADYKAGLMSSPTPVVRVSSPAFSRTRNPMCGWPTATVPKTAMASSARSAWRTCYAMPNMPSIAAIRPLPPPSRPCSNGPATSASDENGSKTPPSSTITGALIAT